MYNKKNDFWDFAFTFELLWEMFYDFGKPSQIHLTHLFLTSFWTIFKWWHRANLTENISFCFSAISSSRFFSCLPKILSSISLYLYSLVESKKTLLFVSSTLIMQILFLTSKTIVTGCIVSSEFSRRKKKLTPDCN